MVEWIVSDMEAIDLVCYFLHPFLHSKRECLQAGCVSGPVLEPMSSCLLGRLSGVFLAVTSFTWATHVWERMQNRTLSSSFLYSTRSSSASQMVERHALPRIPKAREPLERRPTHHEFLPQEEITKLIWTEVLIWVSMKIDQLMIFKVVYHLNVP